MKQFILTALAVLLFGHSFAAPKIKSKSNGYWSNPLNWDLSRSPAIGDTITIPAGYTMIVNDDRVINGFVYLQIYGTLSFQNNNSTLKLGSTAIVVVYSNGKITGGGNPSQKLRIGNKTVFDGNDDPVMGPRMATSATNGFEVFSADPLPVKFTGFSLTPVNHGKTLVQWSTADEINASRFEIERSNDGSNWVKAGEVTAKNIAATSHEYRFLDEVHVSKLFYRIRQIDIDGRYLFSSIRMTGTDTKDHKISMSSAYGRLVIHFPIEMQEELNISIVSPSGQVMKRMRISKPAGQYTYDTGLNGQYFVLISNRLSVLASGQVRL